MKQPKLSKSPDSAPFNPSIHFFAFPSKKAQKHSRLRQGYVGQAEGSGWRTHLPLYQFLFFLTSPLLLLPTTLFSHPTNNLDEMILGIPTATANSLDQGPETENTFIKGDLDYGRFTPVTIARPGVYRLTGPLSSSAGITALTISANNVTLDLDGNTISGGVTGINVTGSNVAIKNGIVQNTSATGITISGNNCVLNSLDVVNSSTAFLLQNTNSNNIANCRALNNTSAGFSLISSSTNSITSCQALNTNGDTESAYGFIAQNGYGNQFAHCKAQGTQTSSTSSGALAAGFLLASEYASTIAFAHVYDTLSLTTTAAAYGIFARGNPLPTDPIFTLLDSQDSDTIYSADWSPDGRYLAVGGSQQVRIYAYTPNTTVLNEILSARTTYGAAGTVVKSIAWSPDGTTLAVGGQNFITTHPPLTLYSWDGSTLSSSATYPAFPSFAAAWSPSGNYLACANYGLYIFDTTLTLKDSTSDSARASVSWLTQTTLAIGGAPSADINVSTYSWNGSSLSSPTNYTIGSNTTTINALSSSPVGSYLALGGSNGTVYLYSHSGTTLTSLTSASHGASINSCTWSYNGKNLVIGGTSASGIYMRQYLFNNSTLTELDTATTPPGSTVYTVDYSSLGLLANGNLSTASIYGLFIWGGAARSCIIKNNLITGTTTAAGTGKGICVDSTLNYIAQNTAYNNDINYQLVNSQYITSQANARGVYNIDTSLSTVDAIESINNYLQINGSTIENLEWSIESKCEKISSKLNPLITLVNNNTWSIESKAEVISSKIDPLIPLVNNQTWSIESKADVISSDIDSIITSLTTMNSKIDVMNSCPATPVVTGGTTTTNKTFISGPITLTQAGAYCLSGNCSGGITVSGNNITLDLNNYTITGGTTGLTISGNNVTVRNGTIKSASSYGVACTANRCTLENITVYGSPTGFYSNGTSTQISDNAFTNCRAIDCTLNGFLVSGCQKNRFAQCAVHNLGSASNTQITGFYVQNGSANTFDSCSVINAYNNKADATASAQGFTFENENYSIVTNCTVNGISTTQMTIPNIPALYGIHAPLTQVQNLTYTDPDLNTTDGNSVSWLENKGNRYLAIGCSAGANKEIQVLKYNGAQLTRVASADWPASGTAVAVNSVDWLQSATSSALYLAIGSNKNDTAPGYEAQIYQFTPPTTLTILSSAGFTVSGSTDANVQQVDWLTTCTSGSPHYYLASAGHSFTSPSSNSILQIHEFDGTTLTQKAILSISSSSGAERIQWLTVGPKAYVAAGWGNGTDEEEIRIYEFTGTALNLITSTSLAVNKIYGLAWLTINAEKYYLAVGQELGRITIFEFDPDASTLTQIAYYTYGFSADIRGVSWLPGIDDLNYLAVATTSSTYEIQILRFDGQCITPIYSYAVPSATSALAVDWLTTSSTILAIGTDGTNTITARTLGFSPTRNLMYNNLVTNIVGGNSSMVDMAAFAVEGNNIMLNNLAYNNNTNYYYTPEYGDSNKGFTQGQ